jgi:hypothetical protein
MIKKTDQQEKTVEDQAELLLKQLMHLKQYEKPEVARMTRNKQNIMREVRNASTNKRKSLGDLLENNVPWLFAEPKYGIALLFIAFAGLQYVGTNARSGSKSTGIYTSNSSLASLNQSSLISTNNISYPEIPTNLRYFPDGKNSSSIKFVERLQK